MADNVRVNQSTDVSQPLVATDDVGGAQYQRIKVAWGPDGSATDSDNSVTASFPTKNVRQIAATSTLVAAGTADVDAAVSGVAGLRLMGFACKETASASASFNIKRGATVVGGTNNIPVNLLPGESVREWFGEDGIDFATGISIDRITGTTEITLWTKVAA